MRTGRPKEENAKRKTITIRLTEDLYKRIVEYAAEHKLSKTDVALQSLEKFLSKKECVLWNPSLFSYKGGSDMAKARKDDRGRALRKGEVGRKRIADIKYSDVLQFYLYLLNDEDLALSTLDNINTLLHPTFQLAVRDEIIRTSVQHISKPRTEAGIRTVPMLDTVYDAFMLEREEQEENGFNQTTVDGMNGFVFVNRNGGVPNPQSINRTIKRIAHSYNAEEVVKAKRERREPIIPPDFSCHHLRHTFCSRLCEHETNLKVIQSIMGHRNIETTMDIYAEATDRKKQQTFENLSKPDIF